jgi:CDGSH-type Zn-finger protein/mannose-6-phosphate isomerase-like protein (cupin superfamily)
VGVERGKADLSAGTVQSEESQMITAKAPVIASGKGFYVEVKAGRRYFWCACGRSATQPFCDGSHAGTEFLPVLFEATADEEVVFCGCKHTGTKPFCDGTHNNLPGGYAEDDPHSAANAEIEFVSPGTDATVSLDGGCYVFSISRASLMRRGAIAYCAVIGPATGAKFQSQFYAEIDNGISPIMSANGLPMILFVMQGNGEIDISGRPFAFASRTGIYVRPDEAFRIHNSEARPIRLFISTGLADNLVFADSVPANFDAAFPDRQAEIDPSQRHKMAERFFQILIDRRHGSTEMTQFIGNIPRSKAEPHRHLYEEAVIFLNGAGVVWTESKKTTVKPGDVLFLPRKQVHSVQCTTDGGLDVVGVICPGDNPSISY